MVEYYRFDANMNTVVDTRATVYDDPDDDSDDDIDIPSHDLGGSD